MNTPITIKAHHIWGYHIKYWIIIIAILLIVTAIMFFFIDELRSYWWYVPALAVATIFALTFIIGRNYKKSLTLTLTSIEYYDGEKTISIPLENLQPVTRGLAYAAGRAFSAMVIESKEMNFRFVVSTMNWGIKDMRNFYAALPADRRNDNADPRTILSA